VENVAVSAGKLLLKYQTKVQRLRISSKEALGVVSEADIASEKLIQSALKKIFPAAQFLGEEGNYAGQGNATLRFEHYKKIEYCWCVDPLDGTTNFLGGFDYYAVCIGLLHFGMPVLGVVYRPSNKEFFSAIKGKGANWRLSKAKSIKIKKNPNLKDLKSALLVTGFSAEKADSGFAEFEVFRNMMLNVRGVRRVGSAALDLCYTARGPWDGFWEKGLAPWDVAAAGLIAMEAGVSLVDFDGQEFHPFQSSLLAARPPMLSKLQAILVPT
jgi:myo-inositol-1(or 4)-monophosphatase